MDTGCSSGWMRRNSRSVRLSPYLIPKLDTISDTASPAPWRRAWMRMNQLPMPASGASRARFWRRMPPSVHGWFRGTGFILSRSRLELALTAISLPHEPQPGEREEVVDLIDLLAERRDRLREAAGRDRRRLDAQLLADAAHDAVALAREAVDDSRAQRRLRAAADCRLGRLDLDLDEP